MKPILAATIALLILYSGIAFASKDRGVYVGAGFNLVNIGAEDRFSNDVQFKVGEILLGYKHNRFVGLEARTGMSLNDEVIAINQNGNSGADTTLKASFSTYTSIYYRAEFANEIAKLYLLLGQTQLSTVNEFTDTNDVTLTDSGFSYGIGLGLWLNERINLNFEIKNLVTTDTDSFFSSGINVDYRF